MTVIAYLRSDRPIVKADRQRLIVCIRRKSGRPNHTSEGPLPKFAASLALALYKEWCSRNRTANVSSRGNARHMQDACAELMAGGNRWRVLSEDQIRSLDGTTKDGSALLAWLSPTSAIKRGARHSLGSQPQDARRRKEPAEQSAELNCRLPFNTID